MGWVGACVSCSVSYNQEILVENVCARFPRRPRGMVAVAAPARIPLGKTCDMFSAISLLVGEKAVLMKRFAPSCQSFVSYALNPIASVTTTHVFLAAGGNLGDRVRPPPTCLSLRQRLALLTLLLPAGARECPFLILAGARHLAVRAHAAIFRAARPALEAESVRFTGHPGPVRLRPRRLPGAVMYLCHRPASAARPASHCGPR